MSSKEKLDAKTKRFEELQSQIDILIVEFEKKENCEVCLRVKDSKPTYYMAIEMGTL